MATTQLTENYTELDIGLINNEQPEESEVSEQTLKANSVVTKDTLGWFLSSIGNHRLLTQEEEIKYCKLAQQGDINARNKMISSNLRLVISVAKRYQNKGLELTDLVQEGIIGLMKAVERFDVAQISRFATYGYHWIFESISKAILDKGRMIRVPVNVGQDIVRIHVGLKNDPSLTHKQLAEKLELKEQKVEEYLKLSQNVASYNVEFNEQGQSALEFIEDETQSTEENIAEQQLKEITAEALKVLNPRDREIIYQRMGFNGEEPLTLEEIASNFNLSRERVRQLQNKAFKKIKKELEKLNFNSQDL